MLSREQFLALLNQGDVVTLMDLEEAGEYLGKLWGRQLESPEHRKSFFRGLLGPQAHVRVRIPKPPRRLQIGSVSSEQLREAPGLRLDASYHLSSPEARAKARGG